jgi:hypothetical protein
VIDFESREEIGCGVGAVFHTVTDICRNDIIVIEPSGPEKFMVRTLGENEINKHKGPKYRVDKGSESGTISLTQIK